MLLVQKRNVRHRASPRMSTAKSDGLIHLRSPYRQRGGTSRTVRRAPIAANLDSICFAFISFDLSFHTEAHRAEFKIQFRRSDSDDTSWFVALAEEQWA